MLYLHSKHDCRSSNRKHSRSRSLSELGWFSINFLKILDDAIASVCTVVFPVREWSWMYSYKTCLRTRDLSHLFQNHTQNAIGVRLLSIAVTLRSSNLAPSSTSNTQLARRPGYRSACWETGLCKHVFPLVQPSAVSAWERDVTIICWMKLGVYFDSERSLGVIYQLE